MIDELGLLTARAIMLVFMVSGAIGCLLGWFSR
ncbi:hypothetical protein HNP60_003377 [Sphingobium sp. B1D3A]|uniref:Uncharacterized protein n=1 Tax=Sphingobium lignivorans TaxID=2735886 RepID=A0ABR6NJE2_9SPHN|nr:hypothetical protein [Sphingobium lignivorans]